MPMRSGGLIGQQIGNYRLVRLLGQGGFADVYLGEHIFLKTQAAIKLLNLSLDSDSIDTFLQEAQTIAKLRHPHIVHVFECGIDNGIPFLVMDYIPNGTLRQRHPRGSRLLPEQIVPYVQQITSALYYAHQQKLIHRDVKPENMLLGQHGEVLLSDFGLALVAQSSASQMTTEMAGTISYMAPEQLKGRPRIASDQYALGVVIYEWLCGERPFEGSIFEIMSQQMLVPPPSLRQKVPELSPDLEQVVLKALEKDPAQRFENVLVLGSALTNAVQGPAFFNQPTGYPVTPSDTAAYRQEKQNPSSDNYPPQLPGVALGDFPEPQKRRGRRLLALVCLFLSLLLVASSAAILLTHASIFSGPGSQQNSLVTRGTTTTQKAHIVLSATPTHAQTTPSPDPTQATASPTPAQVTPSPTPTATLPPQPPTSVTLIVSASGISPTTRGSITIPSGAKVTLSVQPDHSLLPFQTYTMGIYATDPYGFSELQYCTYPDTATCSWVVAFSSSENTDYTKGKHTFVAFLGDIGGRILSNSNSITITWS